MLEAYCVFSRGKGTQAVLHRHKALLLSLVNSVGHLWALSREDPMWSDHSHLHLGGMLGASGKRMRRIAGQLKLDVVAAADECMGEGHHEDKPAFGWNGCAG